MKRPTIVDDQSTIDRPPPREVLGTVEMPLRVPLTPEEHAARSAELADQVSALNEMRRAHEEEDEEAKAAKKERAAAQEDLRERCSRLAHDIRTRSETRPVECEEIIDWTKRIVEVSRIDTGAVVSTRSISDRDRQRTLT